MSTLRVKQIANRLKELFEAKLDLSDLSAKDSDRNSKVLTRCLAALAVQLTTGCNLDEAAASVWDGSGDNGIDAAFYDAAEKQLVLVQAKWIHKGSGEPSAADVGTFIFGVQQLVENETEEFHERLEERVRKATTHITRPGTSVLLVVASTGKSGLASPAMARIESFLGNVNDADMDPIASSSVMGLADVYAGLQTDSDASGVSLELTMTNWSKLQAPYSAYFGTVDGAQVKGWWSEHGKRLVARNIRQSLGNTDVNKQIRESAEQEPEHFWYFNNGITLIADGIEKAPSNSASKSAGVFSLKRASVVNGAQTASSLGKVDADEKLGAVQVGVRVIILDGAPEDFGARVTRTNNVQNKIEPRDFVAQDSQQSRIAGEMRMEDVTYNYVRSENDAVPGKKKCDLVEVTVALACASGDSTLAVNAKTGVSRFFQDLTKTPYKSIFNGNLSGARAFNAVTVLREVDKWLDRKKESLPKRSGREWGVLVHGNRTLACAVFSIAALDLNTTIETFSTSTLPGAGIEDICEASYERIVAGIAEHYPNTFLGSLFKNFTKSKQVLNLAVQA